MAEPKNDKSVEDEPPFEGGVKKPAVVTDKSGAKHTPMSRARDLARRAVTKSNVKEDVEQVEEASYSPGWMLKADPELAKKFKEKEQQKQIVAKYAGKTSDEIKKMKKEETAISNMDQYLAAISSNLMFDDVLAEKHLTPAEMKKREEVAKAIERENPDMPMGKKMAIATATAKKVAEESEDQVDEAMSHQAKTTMKHIKNPTPGEKQAAKDIKPGKSGYADRIAMLKSAQARGALKNEEVEIEEEQLDELDTSTLKSYAKKANKQLKTLNKVVNDNRGKLPNQVKKSIYRQQLKRDVGIDRANSKLSDRAFGITKEEVEQIDELSKSTLGSYADKAERSASKHFDKARDAWERGDKESDDKNFSKGSSRIDNASKARMKMAKEEATKDATPKTEREKDLAAAAHPKDKITHKDVLVKRGVIAKEETEELGEGMISYVDFTDKIYAHRRAGNSVTDHKYSRNKAEYTVVDKEGVGRKVTHTPSGTKAENLGPMKANDDKKEVVQTEKRGRGRPKGSTSGARRHK